MCIGRATSDVTSTAADGGTLPTARGAASRPAQPPRPEPLTLTNVADALRDGPPTPDPELISGVLRVGQKMLLSAPPKVGKTWLAIDLATALATGGAWLGFRCRRCQVVYANLEVSETSFLIRCDKVLRSRAFDPGDAEPMLAFEGRGMGLDAQQFADRLIATWRGMGGPSWGCVIVDCVYQLETGDENAVKDVRPLVAQLDRIGRTIGCALIAIHHHSKGASGSKASIDRAAGSSVFARWPDALIDVSPLDFEGAADDPGRSEACREACREIEGRQGAGAYRMEFDLREFPGRRPLDLFFTDGHFVPDVRGALAELAEVGSFEAAGRRGGAASRARGEEQRQAKAGLIGECVARCRQAGEPATIAAVLSQYNDLAAGAGLARVQRATLGAWLKPTGAMPFHLEPGPGGSVVTPDGAAGSDADGA